MLVTRLDEIREFRESGELSDICVTVDDAEFYLHKFPLFINSDFFRALCRCGMVDANRVNLSHFPGGAKIFSIVADYCYGVEINIDFTNVVELRCAAEFLQMTSQGNLTSETSVALSRILRSPNASVSQIVEIITRSCRLGAIANQTNVISSCFAAIMEIWKGEDLPEAIIHVLRALPIEWFVGLVVAARDNSIKISFIASLVGKYMETLVTERRDCIENILREPGDEMRKNTCWERGDDFDVGEIMDLILVELPEHAPLNEVMDSELLCLLFRLATRLHCKCQGILVRAVSKKLDGISREILVTMPTNIVVSLVEHNVHNNLVSSTILCDTLDKYLWERAKHADIDLDEFQAVTRAIPKNYRQQHDSLLLIIQELFSTRKPCEETKLKVLEVIEPRWLHEETLRHVTEKNIIPLSFIVASTLAVSSRLRNELTEAKAELAEKGERMRGMHAAVADVIKGQWECNDVTINVTPKDADNTCIQFAKVLPRNTSTELSMQHEAFEGKLTLCVRSSRGAPTQELFLFDPFNEQLIEIKRSKYDNLVVGEHYQKKKHTTSYWPFNDVS